MSTRHIRGLKVAVATTAALGVAAAALVAVGGVAEPAAAAKAATPNTAKLAGALAKQKLTWEKCDYADDAINERFAGVENVRCATVKVPRDWKNPTNGKTFDIKISQATNQPTTSSRYKGTIFVNPGGPGGSGLVWAAAMQDRALDLVPYYNFVGFDPRGVGQSSTVTCDYTYTPGTDAAAVSDVEQLKAIGSQCATDPDVKVINTEQTTYDMDFIRGLLKAPKLDYIGYSYGTWLGAWYENVFAANTGKALLDSSTDVTQPTLQRTWELQNPARDRQFEMHLMKWIARHDATYGLGTDPVAIYDRYVETTEAMVENDPVMGRFSLLLTWVFGGGLKAFPDNADYPLAAAAVAWIVAVPEEQIETEPAEDIAQDVLRDLATDANLTGAQRADVKATLTGVEKLTALPEAAEGTVAAEPVTATFDSAFEMIRCNDGQWTQGENYWAKVATREKKTSPFSWTLGISGSIPQCAFWKTKNLMPAADAATFPQTIVAQAELDSQTAWETGYDAGLDLPNTRFLAIDNEGSHGEFPYGTECFDRPIYNLFLTGKLPKKNVKVCEGLPLPQETTTYESWTNLTAQAKHRGETIVSPWVPGTTAKKTAESLDVDAEGAEVEKQLADSIQNAYGQRGVKIAKQYDLID